MYSEQPEVTENKFWSWNAAYENYELYNVCNNHRKNVTIDESQKPGHFCKIKKSPPPDIILKAEKEYMSRKTRTYGTLF